MLNIIDSKRKFIDSKRKFEKYLICSTKAWFQSQSKHVKCQLKYWEFVIPVQPQCSSGKQG